MSCKYSEIQYKAHILLEWVGLYGLDGLTVNDKLVLRMALL
jgi:hypothetical protein